MMKERLESIRYLRAFAALSVVFHHAISKRPGLYNPLENFGAAQAGVDIFFVISGFVLYLAARNQHPADFLARRFVRVVPMYWAATAIVAAVMLHNGSMPFTFQTLRFLVGSFLFIPQYSPINPGEIWPVYIPGWTLQYELLFYVVFAVGLLFRKPALVTTLTLAVPVVVGQMIHYRNAAWLVYTNPLLLEFLAGLFIARYRRFLNHPLLAILVPLGVVALALGDGASSPRLIQLGLPALGIVVGAIALERSGRLREHEWLGMLGDASYSIYLCQFVTIQVAVRVLRMVPSHGILPLLSLIMAAFFLSVLVGLLVHQLFEKPIMRLLTRRVSGVSDTQAAP